MKRFILGAVLLGLVLGPVGQANAALITFEGLGLLEGDPVTKIGIANFANPILAKVGLPTFAYVSDPTSGDDVTGPAGVDFGSFFITDPIISGNPFIPSPITVTFDVPVTDLSFYVLDLDGAQITTGDIKETVTAQIRDNGALVDTIARTDLVPGTSDGTGDSFGTLFAFNNSTPISTLVLEIDLHGWGVDNLAFSPYTTPIPEPGTLLLLGTGFVGMGTMVRRQSKRNRK